VTFVTLVPWTASELPSFHVVELRHGSQTCHALGPALRPRAAVRNAVRPSPAGRRGGGAACAGTDAGAASAPGQDGIRTGERIYSLDFGHGPANLAVRSYRGAPATRARKYMPASSTAEVLSRSRLVIGPWQPKITVRVVGP
jgi:hypothetical protein